MGYAKGVDISHWQNNVPWAQLKADGYTFVYIKVSGGDDGNLHEDVRWKQHYADAKEHGFLVGPYHWFDPSINGTVQAGHMHACIKDYHWDLPYCLDQEENPGGLSIAVYAARVRSFTYEAQELSSRKIVIYTSWSKWKFTGNMKIDVYFWVANWTSRPQPWLPIGVTEWAFWQWGVVVVDRDRFNGTDEELRAFCNVTEPEPPPSDIETRLDAMAMVMGKLVEKVSSVTNWIKSYD